MGILDKSYEVVKDAPKEIFWDDYYQVSCNEYQLLLNSEGENEDSFQRFFEKNPSFLPGGMELFGQSGHNPYMHTVVSQPVLGTYISRKPDFMWLAQNSLTFCPVFIEIEKPNKRMFTQTNVPTAEFNQAINQIDEWKMLLNKPLNQLAFFDHYNIPQEMRDKVFEPQFLLIYGRREEYEDNEYLRNLRKQKEKDKVALFSFDRLQPLADYKQFITCKVHEKKYNVLCIPPTFRYRADCVEELYAWKGFVDKIDNMEHTSVERKTFLKGRYSYWYDFKGRMQGMILSMEGE